MLTHNHRHHHSPSSHSHMACSCSCSCSCSNSTTPSFSFFLIIITLFFFFFPCIVVASNEPLPSPNLTTTTTTTQPPPSITTLYDIRKPSTSGFKPGVAIVVGVLTLVFSLTFILLLYLKHCSGSVDGGVSSSAAGISPSSRIPSYSGRKNSGIDRSVVESLPIFRFGSLTGQKEGLDCAVCLSRFESAEVLRLLPKCKHAFHVECVDTWLDAHSTCPLCRYRVDPEDILLVESSRQNSHNNHHRSKEEEGEGEGDERCSDLESGGRRRRTEIEEYHRRHSSVEVTESEREREREKRKTTSFRRSLDSATATATSRKKNESVGVVSVGCFVRPRKDGMLLTKEEERNSVEQRRLEHRIIVSPSPRSSCGVDQRWSDVQAADLLYLTSEMILSESRRAVDGNNNRNCTAGGGGGNDGDVVGSWNGRGIINSRSVSEITGLSRFSRSSNRNNNSNGTGGATGREEGLVSRWLAWISQSQSHHGHPHPAVR